MKTKNTLKIVDPFLKLNNGCLRLLLRCTTVEHIATRNFVVELYALIFLLWNRIISNLQFI